MSNPPGTADHVLLPGHDVPLGRYTTVRRLLPQRERRMIGAWCFVDHFGPDDVSGRPGMQVPPHPHTGLQTVTWLVDGLVEHRDSLGSHQFIAPGQLNLMTSGHGIAHSEYTPPEHPDGVHGLQLWIALPEDARHGPARFEHHAELPSYQEGPVTVTVVIGELGGHRSPARVHSPLVGAELIYISAARHRLGLDPAFEHGILVMSGTATVGGTAIEPGSLLCVGGGRTTLDIEVAGTARLFLVGGEPFDEPLVMWWNFVGRSHDDIVRAREQWMAGIGPGPSAPEPSALEPSALEPSTLEPSALEPSASQPSALRPPGTAPAGPELPGTARFGVVAGCEADPLPAPDLPTVRLKARDRHGRTY